jgi:hypothetical protein
VPWFRVWIDLRGPARLWAASLGFTVVGASLVWAMPRVAPVLMADPFGALALACLGWVFLGLGLPALVALVLTLTFRRRDPDRAAAWHWWINFLGGLAGALVFAVPAKLLLPLMLGAYWTRPNLLFPTESGLAGKNLGLGALFTVVGCVTLAATWWLARLKLRESPKREA